MFIGKLAKLSGASAKAIRHYESLGILGPVHRAGRYRVYTDDHVEAIRLIRQAQALGFKLSEIRPLGRARSTRDWVSIIEMIADKRRSVGAEIDRLRQHDAALAALSDSVRRCQQGQCPEKSEKHASPA